MNPTHVIALYDRRGRRITRQVTQGFSSSTMWIGAVPHDYRTTVSRQGYVFHFFVERRWHFREPLGI